MDMLRPFGTIVFCLFQEQLHLCLFLSNFLDITIVYCSFSKNYQFSSLVCAWYNTLPTVLPFSLNIDTKALKEYFFEKIFLINWKRILAVFISRQYLRFRFDDLHCLPILCSLGFVSVLLECLLKALSFCQQHVAELICSLFLAIL